MAIEQQVPQEDSETESLGRNGKLDGVKNPQRKWTGRKKKFRKMATLFCRR